MSMGELRLPDDKKFYREDIKCTLIRSLGDYPHLEIEAKYFTPNAAAANLRIRMVELEQMMQKTLDEFVAQYAIPETGGGDGT